MALPLEKTSEKPVVQLQVPRFFSRQVLVKAAPGVKVVPSGIVTSSTKDAYRQGMAMVGVAGIGVLVGMVVGSTTVVPVACGVEVAGRGVAVITTGWSVGWAVSAATLVSSDDMVCRACTVPAARVWISFGSRVGSVTAWNRLQPVKASRATKMITGNNIRFISISPSKNSGGCAIY